MVLTTMLRNIKDTGYPLRKGVYALFTENVVQLALSDVVMVVSTGLSIPLQKAFRNSKGFLRWSKAGMPIHSVFQAAWMFLWIK